MISSSKRVLYIDPKRKLDFYQLEELLHDTIEHDFLLDQLLYESFEGREDDMTSALLDCLSGVLGSKRELDQIIISGMKNGPNLLVIDDLEFIAESIYSDRIRNCFVRTFFCWKFVFETESKAQNSDRELQYAPETKRSLSPLKNFYKKFTKIVRELVSLNDMR